MAKIEALDYVVPSALTLAVIMSSAPPAMAGGVPTLDRVEVQSGAEDLIGTADSATQGTVLKEQLDARTTYRAGELLEVTPGLIVTQHSGEGKANQYFLRGFNLDHGTDMRTTVDGMIVNQRSHGHGQGWTDLNFLIPEIVNTVQYKKGPYSPDEGDFSSAGAVSVNYLNALSSGVLDVTVGENAYKRVLLANSAKTGQGNVLYALELLHNDGPWGNPDDYNKMNSVLRYSEGDDNNGFNVTFMGYRGLWNSSDQIPQRAVDRGDITRWGAIDNTDGGTSYRYSLSAANRRTYADGLLNANAFVIQHKLNLFSNFTYYMDDPVNGDQFEQSDYRTTFGANVSRVWLTQWDKKEVENTVGVQFQGDNILNGLYHTANRQRLSTTREDHIFENSLGVYVQNMMRWSEKFRTVAGLRSDYFNFQVFSDNDVNSGTENDSITNPKLALIFGPWNKTEYYVNAGGGFHSNDARGTTTTEDPRSGDPLDKVDALVRSKGYEVGMRTSPLRGLQTTLALFRLDIDSELLFIGDAGTTEASRPSQRRGVEFANFYTPNNWLTLDADFSYAKVRFTDEAPEGDRVPGAPEGVAGVSAGIDNVGNYFGGLQWRYFGPRPLIEDNSVRSSSTSLINGRIGYKFTKQFRGAIEVYNLLDKVASGIDYYYESQMQGESAPLADIHFHPIESRTLRASLAMTF